MPAVAMLSPQDCRGMNSLPHCQSRFHRNLVILVRKPHLLPLPHPTNTASMSATAPAPWSATSALSAGQIGGRGLGSGRGCRGGRLRRGRRLECRRLGHGRLRRVGLGGNGCLRRSDTLGCLVPGVDVRLLLHQALVRAELLGADVQAEVLLDLGHGVYRHVGTGRDRLVHRLGLHHRLGGGRRGRFRRSGVRRLGFSGSRGGLFQGSWRGS